MRRACARIADGETVKDAAKAEGTTRATLWEWARDDAELGDWYARARSSSADAYDDEAMEVARGSTPETAAADRILIDQLKWAAGKRRPKDYGDRQHLEVSGNVAHLHLDALRNRSTVNNLSVPSVSVKLLDTASLDDTEHTPNLLGEPE